MTRPSASMGVLAWLSLALAAGITALWVLALLASRHTRADDGQRGPVARWSCETVREYVATHGEAAARAKAAELKVPQWVVDRAARCIKEKAK